MPFWDYPITTTVHTTFVHPELQYWTYTYQSIRDAVVGAVEVKRKNTRYLPKLEGMQQHEYEAFKDRAVFFNMVDRTIRGLLGTLFRRNPVLTGIPDKLDTSNISKENQSLMLFVKQVAREIITMGRYGVLLDMDENGTLPPYLAGYVTENIVDWTVEEINGRWLVTEVILRELRLARPLLNPISLTPAGQKVPKTTSTQAQVFSQDTTVTRAARRWIASYRVLRLEPEKLDDPAGPRIYRQYYHTSDRGDASPEGAPYAVFTPTNRGQPFRFIPFVFFGPFDHTTDIQKSPILDIVDLQYSHYRSYAMLEHGRFFTALPVYYAPVPPGDEKGSYTIGPSVVWEVEGDKKPGIIEFNGSGLKFLENALSSKEEQIEALGGRMVSSERVSTGQSNNMLKTKEANEQAMLLNLSMVLDSGFTGLLRWWTQWQDVEPSKASLVNFETNKDFLLQNIGAREFRAIQMMYEAGVIPLAVVYDYLKRAEVIPDWMPLDQFETMLNDPESFPNLADVLARQRGAPSAQSEWEAEHVLVDPQVVAVLGYDSQAPAGQQPLPGQTEGGEISREETLPPKPGAVGPDGKPVVAPAPRPSSSGGNGGSGKATPRRAMPKPGGNDGTSVNDDGDGTPNAPAAKRVARTSKTAAGGGGSDGTSINDDGQGTPGANPTGKGQKGKTVVSNALTRDSQVRD
jgi:hypothetical protein